MFGWWQNRQQRKRYGAAAQALYMAAGKAARQKPLFTSYGVPDSFDGRFDALLLHVAVIFIRLRVIDTPQAAALAQQFFDAMFTQVELSIRESGIGDLSVSRHMKRMMTACQGRTQAYQDGLAATDTAMLEDAIRRNLYGTIEQPDTHNIKAMAAYLRQMDTYLRAQSDDAIMQGIATYPELTGEEKWQSAA